LNKRDHERAEAADIRRTVIPDNHHEHDARRKPRVIYLHYSPFGHVEEAARGR
jgi:hypothetical protein